MQRPSQSLTPMSILDGSNRPGSALGPVVTPAPKTVGAYLQTSTRQLIPDSESKAFSLPRADSQNQLIFQNNRMPRSTQPVLRATFRYDIDLGVFCVSFTFLLTF